MLKKIVCLEENSEEKNAQIFWEILKTFSRKLVLYAILSADHRN
jgi:hypothetical protein